MKQKVYIETSVISYLTSRPSRDLIVAAHQQITIEWWEKRRNDFALFSSLIVVNEAKKGDSEASQKRIEVLEKIPLLEVQENAISLSQQLIADSALPQSATEDALHIAVAAVNGMDYLLTWNCKHIANAEMKYLIERTCFLFRLKCPAICTPEELLGE